MHAQWGWVQVCFSVLLIRNLTTLHARKMRVSASLFLCFTDQERNNLHARKMRVSAWKSVSKLDFKVKVYFNNGTSWLSKVDYISGIGQSEPLEDGKNDVKYWPNVNTINYLFTSTSWSCCWRWRPSAGWLRRLRWQWRLSWRWTASKMWRMSLYRRMLASWLRRT